MKRKGVIFLMSATIGCLCSCSGNGEENLPISPVVDKYPISWQVSPEKSVDSKALVNNDALQQACTPDATGKSKESIGLWGNYTVELYGTSTTYTVFDADSLTYAVKKEDTTNPHNDWNYPGENKFWEPGVKYAFRACYPKILMTSLMDEMEPTVFQGTINTLELQEDILVAATQVNTGTANLAEPVKLELKHIFAAIEFKVKAADGFTPAEGEGVTSCWLQNTSNATNLFSPAGQLVHSGNLTPQINWYPSESSDVPMYVWKHSGISLDEENGQTLYTANNRLDGEIYTHNGGWLLVVPQTVQEGTLQFCYTLALAGEQVFSANIPAVTYEYGKKYTYMLTISGSDADVTLTIAPWNLLESNYDINL